MSPQITSNNSRQNTNNFRSLQITVNVNAPSIAANERKYRGAKVTSCWQLCQFGLIYLSNFPQLKNEMAAKINETSNGFTTTELGADCFFSISFLIHWHIYETPLRCQEALICHVCDRLPEEESIRGLSASHSCIHQAGGQPCSLTYSTLNAHVKHSAQLRALPTSGSKPQRCVESDGRDTGDS